MALVQEGGGEAWGRTTGAKALFCFTAEMTLAGENEKMPCALLQLEGRVTAEAGTVGLAGPTATKRRREPRGPGAHAQPQSHPSCVQQLTPHNTRAMHTLDLAVEVTLCDDV